MLTLFMIIFSP